jgi:predicted DNA-binding protein
MAKGKVIRIRISEKLQKRIDQEADNRGMNRSAFIRHCIEKELPNSKEVVIMLREEIITRMEGERILLDAEWLLENDEEMLEWITDSKYWDRGYDRKPDLSKAIIELQFDEGGVDYYADFEGNDSNDRWPSQNQPPWGEDRWEDWKVEDIKKYYMLVKNNINIK